MSRACIKTENKIDVYFTIRKRNFTLAIVTVSQTKMSREDLVRF